MMSMSFEIFELKKEFGKFIIYDSYSGNFLAWNDINLPMDGAVRVDTKEEAQAVIDFLENRFKKFKEFAVKIRTHLPENILKEMGL